MIALQPLVDAAPPDSTITLPPGEYDDAVPVTIAKNLRIEGPREAIVHSELMLYRASVGLDGLLFQMNKAGAPQKTGIGSPYPQNGMITMIDATLWSDDCSMVSLPGFSKPALHCVQGFVNVRTRTKLANIDWRNNTARVIELFYNSYGNFFDVSGQNISFGIAYQTDLANGSGIALAGSTCILSGANVYKFGTSSTAVLVGRNSYLQRGAGLPAYIEGDVVVDATSRQYP